MYFENKEYLLLLLLIIPYILWYVFYSKKKEPTMSMGNTYMFKVIHQTLRMRLIHLPMVLRCFTLILLIIILARPRTQFPWGKKNVEGINIMIAVDVSTSMLAEDLKPNRMEAAKNVASDFIRDRVNDNIGLTVFAGEAFTQCPMTTDHAALLNLLNNVRTDIAARGMIQDGTAVGMGLANAISRLKDVKSKSKVVILLTDGSNNMGSLSPITAADIAKSLGIRVYTIGLGTNKVAPYPMQVGGSIQYVNMPVDIDVNTLKKIANITGGKFYRATNNKELKQIYHDIDQLEKTKLNVIKYSKYYDVYQLFALFALISFLLEMIVRLTVLQRIP